MLRDSDIVYANTDHPRFIDDSKVNETSVQHWKASEGRRAKREE